MAAATDCRAARPRRAGRRLARLETTARPNDRPHSRWQPLTLWSCDPWNGTDCQFGGASTQADDRLKSAPVELSGGTRGDARDVRHETRARGQEPGVTWPRCGNRYRPPVASADARARHRRARRLRSPHLSGWRATVHTARPPIFFLTVTVGRRRACQGRQAKPASSGSVRGAREWAARNARFLSDITLASRCLLRSANPDEIKPSPGSKTRSAADADVRLAAPLQVRAGDNASTAGFTSNDATSQMPGGYDPNFVHCPSETTSTEPSTTLMAVCSSMA